MKNKRNIIIVFSLALILSFLPSCRNAVEEPAPFGPSSLSILLHTSANPNVLFAGSTREVTNITASLKKFDGTPLSNISIHFEVRNAGGSRYDIGYFEGNQSVKTKTTDSSGLVSLSYYGPTAQEILGNQTLYIYAYAAWEGREIIAELTPVYIVRDGTAPIFELTADPNVLWCTSERPESLITGIFSYAGGAPVVGCKVFFEILSGPGVFSNSKTITFAYTDNEGIASATYIGPTKYEIDADQDVTIRGQPETSTPDSIYEDVDIRLIRGDTALIFKLTADPNVLWCTSERPESLITGIFSYADGTPVVGRKIFFEILSSGPGVFSNSKTITFAYTDNEGIASVTYIGPTKYEIDADQDVTIRGQPETSTPDFISEEIDIFLIREKYDPDLTFELTADPNVLWCTSERPESLITGIFAYTDGAPVVGRKVFFEILSGPGEFSDGKTKTFAVTDEEGIATITYIGPRNKEIAADQFVTIQGRPETWWADPDNDEYYLSKEMQILLIKGTD